MSSEFCQMSAMSTIFISYAREDSPKAAEQGNTYAQENLKRLGLTW
ncbi:MAG: hypothetical protein HGA97_09735 [Chlorobiaceae bacterium]|nr:hypothetical protein [Chlorobiaceae bacterium]